MTQSKNMSRLRAMGAVFCLQMNYYYLFILLFHFESHSEGDQIESEVEETVQEKKIRLAKHFIEQIERRIRPFIFCSCQPCN